MPAPPSCKRNRAGRFQRLSIVDLHPVFRGSPTLASSPGHSTRRPISSNQLAPDQEQLAVALLECKMFRVLQGLDESTKHVDILWLRARPAKKMAYAPRERRAPHILVDLGDRAADALEDSVVRWRNLHLSGLAAPRLENQPVRAGRGSPCRSLRPPWLATHHNKL